MKKQTVSKVMTSLNTIENGVRVIIKKLEAADYLAAEIERDHELGRLSVDSEDAAKAYRKLRVK